MMLNCDATLLKCLLVIKQKGEYQNGCFKKAKHAKFSENKHFLPSDKKCFPWGKICSFFGKFAVLRFVETPDLRSALSLITDVIRS